MTWTPTQGSRTWTQTIELQPKEDGTGTETNLTEVFLHSPLNWLLYQLQMNNQPSRNPPLTRSIYRSTDPAITTSKEIKQGTVNVHLLLFTTCASHPTCALPYEEILGGCLKGAGITLGKIEELRRLLTTIHQSDHSEEAKASFDSYWVKYNVLRRK